MDPLSRKLLKELEEMQERTGRMLRNMSMARMMIVGFRELAASGRHLRIRR